MPRYSSLTLTTSLPQCPDDPSGHFVLSEVRQRAQTGGSHRVLAPGPHGLEVCADAAIEIERLGGERAFGWPGVLARLREEPPLAFTAMELLRTMRSRLRAIDASELVAHWLVPCGLLALEDGRPSTLWAHGSDVRLLKRSRVLTRAFAELLCRGRSQLVFVAEHLRDTFVEGLPLELAQEVRARSSIRPAPIEIEVRPSSAHQLPDAFVVWAGRFVRSKDPTMAARLAERHRIPLVMLGDGPIAVRSSPFVRLLGQLPRPEALAVIAKSRALLSTSIEEGQSTVAREARGLGKPVFALETRGIEEAAGTRLFATEQELGKALESFMGRTA